MHVNVHARLAGGAPDVHADIIAVGMKLGIDVRLGAIEQRDNARLFGRRHVEEIRNMTARDDQHVPARQTVVVEADIRRLAPQTEPDPVGTAADSYLIACGLIGLPVPPVMISGGPQKKNS